VVSGKSILVVGFGLKFIIGGRRGILSDFVSVSEYNVNCCEPLINFTLL
jgi:hypothetical protein